jgi:hypothetical protein
MTIDDLVSNDGVVNDIILTTHFLYRLVTVLGENRTIYIGLQS